MPDVFSQHGELRRTMILVRASIQLGNQDLGNMVLFIRLVHHLASDVRTNGGIENLFLEDSMYFQGGQSPIDDFLRVTDALGFLELLEQFLDSVVVFPEDGDRVILG